MSQPDEYLEPDEGDVDIGASQRELQEWEAVVDHLLRRLPQIAEEMAHTKIPFRTILLIPNSLVDHPKKFSSGEGFDPSSFPVGIGTLFAECERAGLRPMLTAPTALGAIQILGDYELVVRWDEEG